VTDQTPASAPVTDQDAPVGPGPQPDAPKPPQTAPGGFPDVQGRCPACGGESLFVGSGGYITCRRIECPEPDAATTLLELQSPVQPAPKICEIPHQTIGGEDACEQQQLAARAQLIRDQAALAQVRLLIAANRNRLKLADPILLGKLDRVLEQPAELEAAAGEQP
jgi:hypothetical protein